MGSTTEELDQGPELWPFGHPAHAGFAQGPERPQRRRSEESRGPQAEDAIKCRNMSGANVSLAPIIVNPMNMGYQHRRIGRKPPQLPLPAIAVDLGEHNEQTGRVRTSPCSY